LVVATFRLRSVSIKSMSCTQAKACGYHQNGITTQSLRGEGWGEGYFEIQFDNLLNENHKSSE